jgi:hypothetical protein
LPKNFKKIWIRGSVKNECSSAIYSSFAFLILSIALIAAFSISFGSGLHTGQYGSPKSRGHTCPHSGQHTHSFNGFRHTGQISIGLYYNKYLMLKKPPMSRTVKTIVSILKYLSINDWIAVPK